MTKDEAIKIIKTEMECVSRPDCDRLACAYCDLAMRAEDVLTAYQMAIEALQTDGNCISRRGALDDIETVDPSMLLDVNWVKNWVKALPSVQPEEHTEERTETHACDCISRQAAIDATWENPSYTDPMNVLTEVRDRIKALPSVQQEPLSDAYMKAVWTWLLNYQIKAAELKGRYTPYEVLSWVANDWRKEHERSD